MLTDLLNRLRALVATSAIERDLDEELRFHLESEIDKHVAPVLPARKPSGAHGSSGEDSTNSRSRSVTRAAFI